MDIRREGKAELTYDGMRPSKQRLRAALARLRE